MAGYEVEKEIGRNDFHAVHRALRLRDRTSCLLKVAWHDPPRGIDLELLRREQRLQSALRLAGLARPVELTRHDGRAGLVLEAADGVPLRSLLGGGRLALERALDVALFLCRILADLHRSDVVHGGLHPAGVLVDAPTGELTLIDFGFASRGPAAVEPPPLRYLHEALPYVSPEQTGRMNRTIDHRSDLYSLGVILYEMLVGRPPFRSDDPLAMLHAHVARQPLDPSQADPAIPVTLGAIVMKLLSKAAEERYQSAHGVAEDLEACARQLRERRAIEPFALATRDVPDRFLISQKLYGREREVALLHRAFEWVADGPSALVLVAGYSGIGKTSLIQELYKPMVMQRGAFVAGKFDQVVRGIPYGALLQAFRELVQQLLAESEERLAVWRQRLEEALGPNGGVIAEVIPEIELILGPQPRAPELGPTESLNRFRLVLQRFVGTLARPDHPLVVVLDDLQWVDAATLDLLEPLLTSADVRCLLLIGAYRDNEVDEAHPLTVTLRALASSGARVETITLSPLGSSDLTQFIADTLHDEPAAVQPLATLMLEKTGGNPFFAIQFLETLHEDGLLTFDQRERRWTFRIEQVQRAPFTDNVVDLMTRKIGRLPDETRRLLTLAACIGSSFDVGTLSIASGLSPEAVTDRLAAAIVERLLMPARREYGALADGGTESVAPVTTYAFLHDRVQQAAYGLIPTPERRMVHLTVGRLLLKRWDDATAEEKVFDIVHHLNHGSEQLENSGERLTLARLNLLAGRKAKSSTAYREALRYLTAGCAVLEARHWESDYDLSFELHIEAAACEYLCGQFPAAERYFALLRAHARTRLDRARICNLEVLQHENTSRYTDAVRAARDGLALFDVELPDSTVGTDAALTKERTAIDRLLGERPIDSLIELGVMEDPEVRAVLQLLTTAWAPTFLSGNAALTRVLSAIIVRLSLEHGNAEESAYGYVTHAITVGPMLHDYRNAYEWGCLALAVNERFNDRRLRAKIHQQFQAHVNLWRRPLETCIPHAREACRTGLETGDFTYAGYGAFTESWPALLTSRDLDRFVSDLTPSVALLEKIRMGGFSDAQRVILNFAGALIGRTRERLSFTDDGLDEEGFLREHGDNPFFVAIFHTLKLYLCVLMGDGERAERELRSARHVAQSIDGTVWPVLLDFLEGLTLADRAGRSDLKGGVAPPRLKVIAASLISLAEDAPENFGCFAAVIRAEIARLEGRGEVVQERYDAAVRQARQTENPAHEALANERYAQYAAAAGQDRVASRCLREAHDAYVRWGAAAKARDLALRHPEVFGDATDASPAMRPADARVPAAPTIEDTELDVATFAKAASAIAMELILDDLLRKLVRIAIENAGAERGMFLRELDGRFEVEAIGSVDQDEVVLARAAATPGVPYCAAVLAYVRRTRQSVVVADARADARFAHDPYVVRARPRSILAVPIIHQGRLNGVLYLENNLTTDAFTVERVRVLQILSGQAAIALENARLYEDMRQEVDLRRKAEDDLRQAVAELEKLKNRLQAENVYLQEEIRHEHNFEEIVGGSPRLMECLGKLERVAPTDATVLIYGETGTGKELLARALHQRSARRNRPLTKVNCGAIPAGLVESELFGHVKGAFTGALDRRIGRFELADGGTIFLDEVGELTLETQAKLLRVLQEREFEPVGSNRTVRVDVRVVAATNRNLEAAVREGRFRSDLYYRLSVFPLQVPPLRERSNDIPLLVTYFLERFAKKTGRRVDSLSRDTMDRLVRYPWPGNVRELQNVLERAVILSPGTMLVLNDSLLVRAPADPTPGLSDAKPAAAAVVQPPTAAHSLQDVAREHIVQILARTNGVIDGPDGAARLLDVRPSTLRSRMKKLGLR